MTDLASGLWLAMAIAAAPGSGGAAMSAPLRLDVQEASGGVVINLVGNAAQSCEARYELAVNSGSGGNRSVQRGTATLSPGAPKTIATIRLASAAGAGWFATLHVEDCNGRTYEQSWPTGA